MVKIVAISDTHTLHEQVEVPECDILVHAGDFSNKGSVEDTASFISWLDRQDQAKHKVFISGNHDFLAQVDKKTFNSLLDKTDVIYLEDTWASIEGLNFYGMPWTPYFHGWAFNGLEMRKTRDGSMGHDYLGGPGKLAAPDKYHPLMFETCAKIPDDTDIIISHGPPRLGNIDRLGGKGLPVGSVELKKRIDKLENLRAGFYGHIHSAQRLAIHNGVFHHNICICNEMYKAVHAPTVVTL